MALDLGKAKGEGETMSFNYKETPLTDVLNVDVSGYCAMLDHAERMERALRWLGTQMNTRQSQYWIDRAIEEANK